MSLNHDALAGRLGLMRALVCILALAGQASALAIDQRQVDPEKPAPAAAATALSLVGPSGGQILSSPTSGYSDVNPNHMADDVNSAAGVPSPLDKGGFSLYSSSCALTNANCGPPIPNPKAPDDSTTTKVTECRYKYVSVLGAGGQKALGQVWSNENTVNWQWGSAGDVKQGGTPDCGFIAATLALANNGLARHIRRSLVRRYGEQKPGDRQLAVYLWLNGKRTPVWINDALPMYSPDPTDVKSGYCKPYLGAVPSNPDKPIFWVALLEKAVTKLLDRNEALSSSPKLAGYATMGGIEAARALNILTGGKFMVPVERAGPGQDKQIAADLAICTTSNSPCVVGVTLPGAHIGKANANGVTTLYDGKTIVGTVKMMYDSDGTEMRIVEVEDKILKKTIYLYRAHAYAFDRKRTTSTLVSLLNPHGSNPSGPSSVTNSAQITMSPQVFKALARRMHRVGPLPTVPVPNPIVTMRPLVTRNVSAVVDWEYTDDLPDWDAGDVLPEVF